MAGEQAAAGLRLLELYRGFGLAAAARVAEAVAGRAPVGLSARAGGGRAGRSVTIFGDDVATEPVVVEHGATSTTVVGVPDDAAAVRAAEDAVAAGADTVEICGGKPLATAALVEAAVGDRATVTLVGWPFDSLEGAAGYKAAYAEAH
ncbi:hypothetical protein BJF78_31370 [Pseudonocardia sp. CNS-139]|nr:hypothetical protein BJF78_31370 [Pseudonocardia sp. CNS-139]